MVKIKVCGMTRVSDAKLASDLGVEAVGFVFWDHSPRFVELQEARAIVTALPAEVRKVGVFVNAEPAWVEDIVARVGLTDVQLHGDETPAYCESMPVPVLKAVRVDTPAGVETAIELPKRVTPLIDAHDPVRRGGTGDTVDWAAAATVARSRQIFLAGGLGPENVVRAIETVQPYGVDVSSSLETSPGIKDPDRLRAFVAAVREARSNGTDDGKRN